MLEQVALAIDFAHKSGFIHGDIKPENILFLKDTSHCCLSDFGMSKYFSIVERISSLVSAEPGQGGGSAAYLSPEQLEEGTLFPSSDIYSFAIVAYELLTGAKPFTISSPIFKQMQQKIRGDLFDPRDVNPKITVETRDGLLQGLKVDRKERPASAYEFCQMLVRGVRDETKSNKQTPGATMSTESVLVNGQPRKGIRSSWQSLELKTKVGVISSILAALAGIIAAIIKIVPELMK
jgi:serine/threonine protein kinase